MKSWRSRIAAAAVVGVAAVTIPLTAGPASAETNPWGYIALSVWRDKLACVDDGQYALAHGYVNYYCDWDDPYWVLWALPAKDQPPTGG